MSARILGVLDRKVLRDLWRMRGQVIAIALVAAAGVSLQVSMGGLTVSLSETRAAYYERYRFADLWAPVVRAPLPLAMELRAIDGVASVETRITAPVLFELGGEGPPPSGFVHSLPQDGSQPAVNALHLAEGRLPAPGSSDEVVVLDSFASAHGLHPGDSLTLTLAGRRENVTISGVVLSPEWIYAIAPGQLAPDPALFGVIWMNEAGVAAATGMSGAFNEAVVRLMRGASEPAVRAALDQALAPYGAAGAYGRREQVSDAFVSAEIDQMRTMTRMMPPIFLIVAAFLVNIVVSRMVAVEREQIGLLRAFGYTPLQIAGHYLKFASVIALLGLAAGAALGAWLGDAMAGMLADYYHFPFLLFGLDPGGYALAGALALGAVMLGAAGAVRRASRLTPADAMRPPAPADYSRGLGARLIAFRQIDHQSRMVLRQLLRFPLRAGLTGAGLTASAALLVCAFYFADAVEVMVEEYFTLANRQDLSVHLADQRAMGALDALTARPGVMEIEPFRAEPVRLRFGHHEILTALTGVVDDPRLARLTGKRGETIAPVPGGLVLSRDLADRLGAGAGDTVLAALTRGARPELELQVIATPQTWVGSGAQMRLDDLNRALGEGDVINGAVLRMDAREAGALYAELKDAPAVAGMQFNAEARATFREIMDETMGTVIGAFILFACVIALGVAYNAVRVSMAERERELASLRVLGFSRGDVSYILLAEAALITLAALPVGLLAGAGLAWTLSLSMDSDVFRLPFMISPASYGYAGLILIMSVVLSGALVRRRIDRLDMVKVLKTRE
ncbi:ABC transporter permease [Alkalicaulis satelles]|uniref:ABC transporter permease n=1 Tax=Alkalicaulis satelles TaxID=2609175 RepID=A0A5M6ZJI2_9PROT|nr:ABC transporter permease [Alkalicaulis satelles]KAA5804500.1 ABC transporter permease [Alkalicaulis satelles]